MMRRLIVFFFFLTIVLFSSGSMVLAEGLKLETEVNHVANVVEKFHEKVTLFFKFSKEEKYKFQKYLFDKRLSELKYIVESKQGNLIEETSSRYSTYLGNFSDFIINKRLLDKKDEMLKTLETHTKILEKLQENYESESVFRMLLQHDINTIKLFSSKIKDHL